MRLGKHELNTTIDEYHNQLNDIARDEKTLVYLDTNILAYMYKLHAKARKEFYNWVVLLKNKNRIFIPNWAANEYSNRVTTGRLRDYTNASVNNNVNPSNANKMYEALYEMAALFVDDSILPKYGHDADRDKYLADFRDAINQLNRYTKPFKTQFKVGEIHKEIDDNFSDVVLESNVSELCARADSEGPSRFQHRLPPGFEDGGKDENTFGDLIIWFEILDDAASKNTSFEKVLFLTNDEKKDWVYAPTDRVQLVNEQRKTIPNKKPQIKIAHPRLIDEFKSKVGHERLTVCSLANLIESLSKQQPTHFTNIAGAIQIDIQIDSTDPVDHDEGQPHQEEPEMGGLDGEVVADVVDQNTAEIGLEEETGVQDEPLPHEQDDPFEYSNEALQDEHYPSEAPGEINEIIEKLKSHNWYQQNPAITKVLSVLQHDSEPSAVFVLGRNIYQSACGNSQKATEFIASLDTKLSKLDDEVANHLLAGMVFEIYFDAHGLPRQFTKFDYANKVLSVITKHRYESAKEYIVRKIVEADIDLAFHPGSTAEPKLTINLVMEPQEGRDDTYNLTSVVFDGNELLVDDDEQFGFISKNYDIFEIRDTISNHFSVPTWALETNGEHIAFGDVLVVPEDKKLSI
ncbi:PIN-like domain-containing protein [Vibrio mediterranei]|uniref:PIN-like domain-containing protein n=1 Tax=Vibrio mediterranei TaxID=689 RepID=UPI0038CEC4FF